MGYGGKARERMRDRVEERVSEGEEKREVGEKLRCWQDAQKEKYK